MRQSHSYYAPLLLFLELYYIDKGTAVFKAEYDAWGKQTVRVNTMGLRRGYTGHEMLSEFGIINMNGRLYDPVLGRFFSPDPVVQFPGSPQGYNRYSYCLNNPLKYTDPGGQMLSPAILFGIFNLANSMMSAAFNGDNIWKAGAVSILSSSASYGVGQIFKGVGSFGHELLRAGAHGAASGVLSMLCDGNFGVAFLSGAAASGIGSLPGSSDRQRLVKLLAGYASGGLVSWDAGESFVQGALRGLNIGLLNHEVHYRLSNTTLWRDGDDNLYGDLPEFVYENKTDDIEYSFEFFDNIFRVNTFAKLFISIFDVLGKSLWENAGNTTISRDFKKIYWHAAGKRTFMGNQYKKVFRLDAIGKGIHNITGPVGGALDVIDFGRACFKDYMDSKVYGKTDHYHKARFLGEWVGGWIGCTAGVSVGGSVGVKTASPQLGVVASVTFGIGGSCAGSYFGGLVVDDYYRANGLFIP